MFRRALIFSIATFLIAFSARSVAQVLPSAKQSVLPFEIAGGLLSFHPDIGSGYMRGYTIWGDYSPAFLTNRVHGLAIEAQLKNIAFNRSTSQTNVTEKTFLGGANYSWHRYRNFYPMASAKVGYGSLDFLLNNDYLYTHDSRVIFSFSGGGQYRLWENVWAHADYEYQYWPQLFSRNLHPRGLTFGLAYDFRPSNRRY